MKNTKVRIKIEFEDTNLAPSSTAQKQADGSFEVVFSSQDQEHIIDVSEQALLQVNSPALRDAISDYLSTYSKKKP